MVFYDYKCKECNIIKEVEHGMNDSPEIKCAKCGKVMNKVIGIIGIKYSNNMTQSIRI